MPAGIPLDHFHRWGCDGKRLLHGISIDCNKKVSGFARGSSAVPLGEGKASSPSQSNPSDLSAPPKGGASDASARLAFYLETAPLLQKAPPSGELANECEPERVQHAESKQVAPPQRRAFAESGAVNAVFLYDPICEKAIQENPQIFLNCNYKINFPLNMPRARRRAFKIVPA